MFEFACFFILLDTLFPGILIARECKEQAFMQRLGQENLVAAHGFDVKSTWFSVLIRVQQDDVLLGAEALVRREDVSRGGAATVVWRRPLY